MQTKEILPTSNSKQTPPQKLTRKQKCKLSLGAGEKRFLREVICLRRKKKGKSRVLSGKFCARDLEAEQRVLQFLHIYCSNVNNYSSAPESKRQSPPGRTMGLPVFFRYQVITSLKNVPLPAPSENLPFWFQGNFAAIFVLNY